MKNAKHVKKSNGKNLDNEALPRLFNISEKVQERQTRKERQQEEILGNQALTKMFYRDEKSQERQARKEVQEEDILDNKVLPRLFEKHNSSIIGKFKHVIGIAADKIIGAYNAAKDRVGHVIAAVTDKAIGAYNVVKHSMEHTIAAGNKKIKKVTNWVKSIVSKDSGIEKPLNIEIGIDDELSLTNSKENQQSCPEKNSS
ncbi:MAG: hypothetical protein PG981_000452 [Wolbachia endosymbiont of Ctenocephalides orientis wCori]|nr:MAG: hypothetical protein PG981_000452 [Wolbachia endosymbiont of Ctenocephalides orientis wCori]